MPLRRALFAACLATSAGGSLSVLLPLGTPLLAQAPTLDALILAEDARGRTAADLATLRAGARAADPELRRHAVRGLGRLERGDVLDVLVSALADAEPGVRRRAADAVAQAAARGEGVAQARAALVARLSAEPDSGVRGELAEALGRLRATTEELPATADALARQLPLRGAVRGLFFLTRQPAARGKLPATVGERLQAVATTADLATDVRATAAAARLAGGGATAADSAALGRDASGEVRALVATAASIGDPAPVVRHRAVALAGCTTLVEAVRDSNAHVALAAVDALARCSGDANAVAALARHPSPRALVALAAIAPADARARLATVAASRDAWARLYAARAAVRLADTVTLRRLARDADANVRGEAIDGLAAVSGRADVATYVAALRSDAPQVLMAAAKALAGAGQAAPLVAALDRVTARGRDTERDARMAIVAALGAAVPARYARDADPVLARRAAELAGVAAAPGAPARRAPAVPTVAELRTARSATIEMADGGRVVLRLFPMDAPTNTWRFVRLARAGYFDGLTFHRVVPFFVVQGGSPLANEYAGDGPFTRDEVGLENRRGTVGISTRGRDTGDGQLYFNTVDNVRLDHDYTVFAEVTEGMAVVDRMQEGARIRRVTVQ